MANDVKLNLGINSELCEVGDVFLIDGLPYILAILEHNQLVLICLKNGCRWCDPFFINSIGRAKYNISNIIHEIIEGSEDGTSVEYMGAVKIEVMK